MPADRELVIQWWTDAWTDGLWAAPWGKSLDGLTPEQAAWNPPSAPGVAGTRHSIWQIVLHMTFWREVWLRRVATGHKPTKEETVAGNFPVIAQPTAVAWAEARRHLEETQTRIAAALRDLNTDIALAHFLPHDSYHFGQINLIRAMLGLPPIE